MNTRTGQAQRVQGIAIDPTRKTRPGLNDVVFHLFKTGKLVSAVFADPRVPAYRKLIYGGVIMTIMAALIFPEALADIASSFTVIGPLLGIPAEGVLDWSVLGVTAYSLMRIFPQDVVAYHYQRIFGILPPE